MPVMSNDATAQKTERTYLSPSPGKYDPV